MAHAASQLAIDDIDSETGALLIPTMRTTREGEWDPFANNNTNPPPRGRGGAFVENIARGARVLAGECALALGLLVALILEGVHFIRDRLNRAAEEETVAAAASTGSRSSNITVKKRVGCIALLGLASLWMAGVALHHAVDPIDVTKWWRAPVVIAGTGGSGTRGVVEALQMCEATVPTRGETEILFDFEDFDRLRYYGASQLVSRPAYLADYELHLSLDDKKERFSIASSSRPAWSNMGSRGCLTLLNMTFSRLRLVNVRYGPLHDREIFCVREPFEEFVTRLEALYFTKAMPEPSTPDEIFGSSSRLEDEGFLVNGRLRFAATIVVDGQTLVLYIAEDDSKGRKVSTVTAQLVRHSELPRSDH